MPCSTILFWCTNSYGALSKQVTANWLAAQLSLLQGPGNSLLPPINMAFAFSILRSRVFGRLRYLNQVSNQQSTFTSTRKKQSNAAFLFGFGLAGLVGFSGILYKKQRKRIAATSVERDGLSEEHCSSQSVSVSFYCQLPEFHHTQRSSQALNSPLDHENGISLIIPWKWTSRCSPWKCFWQVIECLSLQDKKQVNFDHRGVT